MNGAFARTAAIVGLLATLGAEVAAGRPAVPGDLRRAYFRDGFDVLSIEDTRFQGTLDPAPHALFATFRRR